VLGLIGFGFSSLASLCHRHISAATPTTPIASTKAMQMRLKIVNPLSWFSSAESALRTCQLFSIGAGVVTVAALIGQVWSGRIVNTRQAKDVIDLRTKLEEQRERTDEQRERTAKAEKDLLELQSKLAFRTIKPEDAARMSESLKKFAPQVFDILWYPDDQESYSFANEIYNILRNAGWVLNQSNEFLGFGLEVGIKIEFRPEKQPEFGPAMNALATELGLSRIKSVTVAAEPKMDEKVADRIRIRVGKKP